MKLIVGLGNPGQEYAHTRHNVGFMAIDKLAEQMKVNFSLERKLKAETAMLVHNNETLILAKPQTFMNLSGESVAKIAKFYKLEDSNIWVVSDDIDLGFGTIRVRYEGSSGGHNGLKSIIEKIGEEFGRFRIGIKNPSLEKISVEAFVLQKFSKVEAEQLPNIIDKTCTLIHHSLEKGLEHSSHQNK